MFPDSDDEFYETQIAQMREDDNSFTITGEDGWGIGLSKDQVQKSGANVRIGATVRFYGRGIGYRVRGIFVGGVCLYYRTDAEDEASFKAEQESQDLQRRKEYDSGASDRATRIAALPQPFQERLARFRRNRPETAWRNEAYELFVCEEAAKILAWTGRATHGPGDGKAFRTFVEANQAAIGISDQHSGNTFASAVALAFLSLRPDGDNVVTKWHAAICSLLGCDLCGCYSTETADRASS